jgi:hypothetical protein
MSKAVLFYLHIVILAVLNVVAYGSWAPALISHDSYEGVVAGFALIVLVPILDVVGIEKLKKQWQSIGAQDEKSN